jgi:glycosyltransferase involved in cell wall biosynthesis
MNKISVITINYNDKKGLKKTIDSVVSQTFKDFEFIIIDGGSNDGSVSVIEENKDEISYWVSEPDSGIYNAMNKGIKAATGDFVIFMNSGDCFYSNTVLEEVLPDLQDDFDIYYGDCYRVTGNNLKKWAFPEKLSFSFFYSSSLSHQSTFIRRKLFYKFFMYNENFRIVSDWEFFIYAICKENTPYKHLDKVISNFDFTGISSNKNNKEIDKTERVITLKEFFPSFIDDYKDVSELNSKRFLQFQHIKKYRIAWRILKATINIILLFLPRMQKQSQQV